MKLFLDRSWARPRPTNLRQALAFKLLGIATSYRGQRAIETAFARRLKLMLVKERAKGHPEAFICGDSILGPGIRSTRGLAMLSLDAKERANLKKMRAGRDMSPSKRRMKAPRRPENVYFCAGGEGFGRVRLMVNRKPKKPGGLI